MPWSYNPLWKTLIDKKLKRTQLIELAGISTHTLSNMSKDNTISMDSLEKLCDYLDCRIEDIVEYIPKEKD